MPSFDAASDDVVEAAYGVMEGRLDEGTLGIRRVERDDGPAVYRIAPDADPGDVEEVQADGEFPDADAVMWRADGDRVRNEVERRDLQV